MPSESNVIHLIRPEEAAYAAGFFDGEGCIAIACQPSRMARGKRSHKPRYWLNVSLSQNDPAPLVWMKDRFGGAVRFRRGKRSYDQGEYQRWDWVASTAAALIFLRTVRPFLIVKASQADLAFQFAETVVPNRRNTPSDVQTCRADLFSRMRSAKHQEFAPRQSRKG